MMEGTGSTIVKDYVLEDDFFHLSGGAQWTFAEKDGMKWFIKRFNDPVFPNKNADFDPDYVKQMEESCKKFYRNKRALYDAVNSCANGNIVTIDDFFMWNSRYHVVTQRILSDSITVKDVSVITEKEKYLLLKTITNSMAQLHEKHIVYADIRPDNVLLKRSPGGKLIAKLIDFDGCYFEYDPPEPNELPISEEYIAPETAEVHYNEKKIRLTQKVDVYSLGLLFHLYWTGELPGFNSDNYDFPFEPVLDGLVLNISPDIPYRLSALIKMMVLKDPDSRPAMKDVLTELKMITGDIPDSFSKDKKTTSAPTSSETINKSKPDTPTDSFFVMPLSL